MNLNQ